MAKMTLLELTQKVLSSMSSDEVNSISDTVEAAQVVDIIEDVYYNIIGNSIIPEHEELIKLTGLSDSDHPNYLKIPTGVIKIAELYYNVYEDTPLELEYKQMDYVEPAEFLRRNTRIDTTQSNITKIEHFDGTQFAVVNDSMPSYYTTFDDEYLVFNSYMNTVDSTLQASKSMAMGLKSPTFTKTDSFTPDLDDHMFPLLLNEAKVWAHAELKQSAHNKAEQQSRRQLTRLQKHRDRITKENSRPNYGRR